MNCKFQIALSLLFFSSFEKTYHKVCVCKIEEAVVWQHFAIQRTHKNLEIGICFFLFTFFDFPLSVTKKDFGKQWIQFSDIMIIRHQLPFSFCDFELFFWLFPFSLKWRHFLSCFPHFTIVVIYLKNLNKITVSVYWDFMCLMLIEIV